RVVAHVGELDLAADRRFRDGVNQVVPRLHRVTIHAGNDVSALESSLFRRAPCLYAFNHYAVRRAKRFQSNRIRADFLLEADANRAARYAPLFDDLVINLDRCRGGQRESNSLVAAAAGDDRCIDSNHLPREVDQRPTRVSGASDWNQYSD